STDDSQARDCYRPGQSHPVELDRLDLCRLEASTISTVAGPYLVLISIFTLVFVKFEVPLAMVPVEITVPILLLTYGLEILVTYLVREKLQTLEARLEIVIPPLYRCSRAYDQSVTILIFDEHRSVCLSENYCSA